MDETQDPGRAWGWKRISRFIGGWLLVLVGVVGCILPILPGVPLIFAGLALLASEYTWAQRLMDKLKAWLARLKQKH